MPLRNTAPLWFWGIAILLTLWGAIGVFAFYADRAMTAADVAKLSAFQQDLRAHQPYWLVIAYGVSVWSGLLGALALLLRSALSRLLFVVSLVSVVLLFGWVFATTGIIAAEGFGKAAAFPIFIIVVALFQVWLATQAIKRGWIA